MRDSTTAMSDLPQDVVEEVLSSVPLTSLRAVRTTCKKWNNLSKHRSFTKKHIRKSRSATKKKEFLAIMMMDSSVYLISVGIHKDDDYNAINRKGKLISLNDVDGGVDISNVFHCSGLLLCTTNDKTPRLVVWNPYRGQTRWIETTYRDDFGFIRYSFALGYEKKDKNSHRSLKILRSIEKIMGFVGNGYRGEFRSFKFEIYNFNSNSWKDITLTAKGNMRFYKCGVSLKGNTYWLAKNNTSITYSGGCLCCARRRQNSAIENREFFLICFDFTTERFGPRLSLPFHSSIVDSVTLSSVRDEQLAVLFQRKGTLQMEIWITSNIEPEAASWSMLFLVVDKKTLLTYDQHESFFVDEEKKVVMVFAKDKETKMRNVAYCYGEDGYFETVVFGESTDKNGCPLVCSYVPSSVQIK
ncbi:F-box domain [Arabidopsis suecica]|uniref:F-box domain n=1 Tax=Arabidopsis suecica TaxID=45249 RepID=A0A8T2B668_ARASU|nr:F-box domain [Arabidopsis suecica]